MGGVRTARVGIPGPVNFVIAPLVSTTTTHGLAGSVQLPFKATPSICKKRRDKKKKKM